MTLSSADNPLQTVRTQIRPDILSRPNQDPDCLTLYRLCQTEVEQIYFNYALNIYMTLSSDVNPLQTVCGPKSSSTFCQGLNGVEAV